MKVNNGKLVPTTKKDIERMFKRETIPGRLAKIREFYFDGVELSEEDERMRIIYLKIFTWSVKYLGNNEKIVKKIIKDIGTSQTHAYRLIKHAIELHGEIEADTLKEKKMLFYKKYLKLHEYTLKEYKEHGYTSLLAIASGFLEKAERIASGFNKSEIVLPTLPDFGFTTNPKALEKFQITDTEFEDD